MRSRTVLIVVLITTTWMLQGCTRAFDVAEPAVTAYNPDPSPTPVVENLNIKILEDITVSGYNLQKIRIKENLFRAAYVAVFAAGAGVRGTVLISRPFDGIAWSLETIDQKWAARPGASVGYTHADDDSLGYTTGDINYKLASDANLYAEAMPYLQNGINVAFVFTRFYAGGTIDDQVGDTNVALRYLKSLTAKVNASKIGLHGRSLGGFSAGYAAGDTTVAIKSMVLTSPLYDLGSLSLYNSITLPGMGLSAGQMTLFDTFFAPFTRRIYPETGGPIGQIGVDYSTWAQNMMSMILSSLAGKTLVIADESDTVVPFAATKAVVDAATVGKATGLWFTHAAAINYTTAPVAHVTDGVNPMADTVVKTVTVLETMTQLGAGTTYNIPYNSADFAAYMAYMHGEDVRGQDMSGLLQVLIQMTVANVNLVDSFGTPVNGTGAQIVANQLVAAGWVVGGDYTAATIHVDLQNISKGMPAP